MSDRPPGLLARALLVLVTGYRRWLSPLLGPRCRFLPTCSAYAAEALTTHGAGRGGWLAVRRVARCHPFHPGGHDPVPPRRRLRRAPGPGAATMAAPGTSDHPASLPGQVHPPGSTLRHDHRVPQQVLGAFPC